VLNRASPLPLYHQLAELLGERIRRGELTPGAQLPSEPELSRLHRIGRPTVRQATDLLMRRGMVERRRGSGTYVTHTPRVDLFTLAGTLSSFEKGGLALETRLLSRVLRTTVAAGADNPLSGREAFCFSRLGRVDGVPVLVERLFLDAQVFPDLPRMPLAGQSLSRLVEERYFLKPSHADQSFRVHFPARDVRAALQLAPRAPALRVNRTLHFPGVGAAIFCELDCRTDRFTFCQTIGDASHV
jgi:GntR family transcriptional regulator